MDTNTAIKFIEKAIEKTKSRKLRWGILPNDFIIKSFPGEEDPNILDLSDSFQLSREDSYFAKYETSQLLLLVKRHILIPCIPPDNCELSLRIQNDESKFSVEITNSSYDPAEATALIRLYNLIDKDTSSLTTFIQDFLNS